MAKKWFISGGSSGPGRLLTEKLLDRGDSVAATVDAIIAAADTGQPPLRLALGSTAYASISSALTRRLESLESQREVALQADWA